jgi:hypothetical protein
MLAHKAAKTGQARKAPGRRQVRQLGTPDRPKPVQEPHQPPTTPRSRLEGATQILVAVAGTDLVDEFNVSVEGWKFSARKNNVPSGTRIQPVN